MTSLVDLERDFYEDGFGKWSARFRRRRFRHCAALINRIISDKGRCRILDLGGSEDYWIGFLSQFPEGALDIELVNLDHRNINAAPFRSVRADATDMESYEDNSYDLVHSNSLIEHLRSWAKMRLFAENVRRLAPFYFVQVPNQWFPYEPHYRRFLVHWLPEQVRARRLMKADQGFYRKTGSIDDAMTLVEGTKLLDAWQFSRLFPDGRIVRERIGPFTKSLMAVRER